MMLTSIYEDDGDRERMFSTLRYVIKDGRVLVEDGHVRETYGRILRRSPL
jgi:formylmethanofuran dehydrogenase subunit A